MNPFLYLTDTHSFLQTLPAFPVKIRVKAMPNLSLFVSYQVDLSATVSYLVSCLSLHLL